MKAYSLLLLLLILTFIAVQVQAQSESSLRRAAQGKVVNNDELVSFKSDVPYNKAVQALGELSKKLEGKLIIDRSPLQGKDKGIGINIESMYWKDALELILRNNQLWYNDYPEYMEIVSFEEVGKTAIGQPTSVGGSQLTSPGQMTSVSVHSSELLSQTHEVSITGVFFDLNKTKLDESGMTFNVSRGSGVNFNGGLHSSELVTSIDDAGTKLFSVSVSPSGQPVSMDAAFAIFSKDQIGEVIARPQLVVRSGTSSQFQVGQDFSVLEKDFSGNTVQKFYPTGTILTVRPKIYKVGEAEFIDIQYKVEKSSFTSASGTSIINRTLASGSLLLLNGEEGYVAGLYSNDETTLRQGIPILKDLPPWFFGLRYLFGYNNSQIIKRELIVLLKAEILPSVSERAIQPKTAKNIIKESIQEMEKDQKRRIDK
jgi:general secretion pathway protein D